MSVNNLVPTQFAGPFGLTGGPFTVTDTAGNVQLQLTSADQIVIGDPIAFSTLNILLSCQQIQINPQNSLLTYWSFDSTGFHGLGTLPKISLFNDGSVSFANGAFTGDASGNCSLGGGLTANTFLSITGGSLFITQVGQGISIKGGANAKIGEATLVAGSVTVANTAVTANSLIFLSRHTPSGTLGHLSYTTIAGTSFTITATGGAETSVISWMIVEKS